MEEHLANFRVIRNYVKIVADVEIEGRYNVEVILLKDGQTQFLRLFFCPYGCVRTLRLFEGIFLVDAAHFKSVIQAQLFTQAAYDAKTQRQILAFVVASNEGGETLCSFIHHCL